MDRTEERAVERKTEEPGLETKDFAGLLKSISGFIEEGRKTAVRKINTAVITTYWLIGMGIVEYEQKGRRRAVYGEETLKKLAGELTRKYGNGFSFPQLKNIRQFYLTYRSDGFCPSGQRALEKGYALRSQFPYLMQEIALRFPLSWTHYRFLMRFEEPEKRTFYEKLSIEGGWSSRHLEREIDALLFERTALSKRRDIVLARANENVSVRRPEDEVKDSYVLDFLGLKDEYSESDLEDALIRHIESFLLELGRGFAFVARQKRFVVGGDEYRIDLLLFNIALDRYIVVELKLDKFTHSHAGQINFYVNWVKDNVLPKAANDPFGIILCSEKNNATVRYATGGLKNRIFVSKYMLELPRPEELARELERGRELFLRNRTAHRLECEEPAAGVKA